MHPELLQLGPITIYTYGVLAAVGFLCGLLWAYRQAPRAGLDPHKVWNLTVYGILVSLVTAKTWLVLTSWSYFAANPREMFSISTIQSAGTFYGGMLGAMIWVVLYTHFQKMSFLAVMDVTAAPVALGHAIGRVGCFMAGCCFGKPTSLPWGVTFTNPVAERIAATPLNVALHPTQLYEAAAEFLNFLLLVLLGSKPRARGQLVGAYFMLYGVERGVIEFFRDDPGRTLMFHGAVSLMQLVSVALALTGAWLFWRGVHGRVPATPPTRSRAALGRS